MPTNLATNERLVTLETGLRRYQDSASESGKAIAKELKARIANVMAGVPETQGIVEPATETGPGKSSVINEEEIAPVPKPTTEKVAPSIAEIPKNMETYIENQVEYYTDKVLEGDFGGGIPLKGLL